MSGRAAPAAALSAHRPASSPPRTSRARPARRLQDMLSREVGIQTISTVRRQERRRHDGRPARLRRDRDLQHARSAQRPPADRHRSVRHRFQHDPARQHRAHRNHPRQQRRGALRRRRGRRRHQHRHQDRRGAAAVGARRGRLRLVQPARRQCLRRGVVWARSRFRCSATGSIRTAIASTTTCASATRSATCATPATEGSAWFNISGDDQHLGLPGARLVDVNAGINELVTDRRGATTPNAFSQQDRRQPDARRVAHDRIERRTDRRRQRAPQGPDGLFVAVRLRYLGHSRADHRLGDAAREHRHAKLFGAPTKITTGIDYYNSSLDAKRSVALSDPPYPHLRSQAAIGGDLLAADRRRAADDRHFLRRAAAANPPVGARPLRSDGAGDAFPDAQATPLDSVETQHALHLGFEHRFSPMFAVFGRARAQLPHAERRRTDRRESPFRSISI